MRSRSLAPGTMTMRRRQETALSPVRAVLLREAAAEADRVLGDAQHVTRAQLAQASADAAAAVSQARAAGRAQASLGAAAELSRGRREARRIVLDAESRARAELEGQIRAAIGGLRHDPGYGELRARLSDLAQRAAGPGAIVSEHPGGGVVARAPGVLVDCSLLRLAERAIGVLGPRIKELTVL